MGNLYIVSTPIGNLEDITLRALETLKKVDLVLAEDTRRSGVLLNHYSIKKPFLSFHEHNEEERTPEVLKNLEEGKDIALISDAGTPTLADPGFKLVRECVRKRISVYSVPGPSSILAALVTSGLPTDSFSFIGYVPKKEGKRKAFFEKIARLADLKTTVIFFESPYRLVRTLKELNTIFPEKEVVIARELTKIHEEFIRGKVKDLLEKFEGKSTKGEITILLR